MEQVEELCEEIVLVNNGKNILQGKVKNIKQEFKRNAFILTFEGELPDITDTHFTIESIEGNDINIKLNEGWSSTDLLKFLLSKKVNIVSFNEVLPSLNEIFIDVVNKN